LNFLLISLPLFKQNGHAERVIDTLKADWLWLQECDTYAKGQVLVTRTIREYNKDSPQSALAFLSPDDYPQATLKVGLTST
jgi:hypothetical protein